MSLAIFFSFYGINFRGSCDLHESQLPLFWIIYFPIALYGTNAKNAGLFSFPLSGTGYPGGSLLPGQLCKRECQRIFKTVLGLTPSQYFEQYRLSIAVSLLLNTQESIMEISGACGFQSPSYFAKLFRNRYGMTPSRFRTSQTAPSLCHKQNSQRVGPAVAGNGAACLGDVNLLKFHGFSHRLFYQERYSGSMPE